MNDIITAPARLSFPISGEFWRSHRPSRPELVGYGNTREASVSDLIAKECADGFTLYCDTCGALTDEDDAHIDESGAYCMSCREKLEAEQEAYWRPLYEGERAQMEAGR